MQLFIGDPSYNSNYKLVDKHSFFNEYYFFSGIKQSNVGAKSIGSSYLAYIPRDEFIKLVQSSAKDYVFIIIKYNSRKIYVLSKINYCLMNRTMNFSKISVTFVQELTTNRNNVTRSPTMLTELCLYTNILLLTMLPDSFSKEG